MSGAAALPMYDWPEIRAATDAFWATIRAELAARGLDAPDALVRGADPEALWTDPALLLSQTCGFPYANALADKVTLVGTPAHAVTGAAPGKYFSVLVARKSQMPQHLAELAHMRFAYNMAHSQSGFAAPVRLLAASGHASLPKPLETGAHRASVCAVAAAQADWAAIDAVAWELSRRHEPAAEDLVVFARTPETPGLPLITSVANAGRAGIIADAVEAAVLRLEPDVRDQLFLTGLVRFKHGDYAPLAAPLPVEDALPGMSRI